MQIDCAQFVCAKALLAITFMVIAAFRTLIYRVYKRECRGRVKSRNKELLLAIC
jgi:hypothetical protein